MGREDNQSSSPYGRKISRREFIKLAAMAGLLAGCGPVEKLVTPTHPPAPTATPTTAPTTTPMATPIAAPTATPTTVSTAAPITTLSRVVHTHHAGVWDGDALVPEALGQMLDASITALTGLDDASAAWAALFDPTERIAIKVNTIQGSSGWTRVPLVTAVTERLQAVGVPAEQIVVFDRHTWELRDADYAINQEGPGVRCYGTDGSYTSGWQVAGTDVQLSNILLNCDAFINMPILKQHMYAGISFAMKNHYGTFDRPNKFHHNTGQAIPELNALPPIRDRARLIIGDALTIVLGDSWGSFAPGDSIFMSLDPVAHDTVALQFWSAVREAHGGNPTGYVTKANAWLAASAELGLGTNDPSNIELVEVTWR